MNRRSFMAFFVLIGALSAPVAARAAEITVYKSPTCGCCSKWVDHLRGNGFDVKTKDVRDVAPYKARHGVPAELGSCHTAVIEGYVIEGHVPAQDIRRLLQERPKVTGLAVPGMPMGSPGMDDSGMKEPYNVISFDKAGSKAVYARH